MKIGRVGGLRVLTSSSSSSRKGGEKTPLKPPLPPSLPSPPPSRGPMASVEKREKKTELWIRGGGRRGEGRWRRGWKGESFRRIRTEVSMASNPEGRDWKEGSRSERRGAVEERTERGELPEDSYGGEHGFRSGRTRVEGGEEVKEERGGGGEYRKGRASGGFVRRRAWLPIWEDESGRRGGGQRGEGRWRRGQKGESFRRIRTEASMASDPGG